MLIVGILVALLAIGLAFAYLTVMVTIGVIVGVFWFWTVVIAFLVGDPYVGFVGSFVATGLTLFTFSYFSDPKT
jgi:hypothetical protein